MIPVIILDLDRSGIEFISPVESSVQLQEQKIKRGWIRGKSAFLFADYNGSGCADIPLETSLKTGEEPTVNGLIRQDLNKDQRIDEQDDFYAQLYLWQDKNEDGICVPTEVRTLASYGISLELNFKQAVSTVNDNKIVWQFSYNIRTPDESGNAKLSKDHVAIDALLVERKLSEY